MAEPSGRGHVRTPTHVDEGALGSPAGCDIAVEADRRTALCVTVGGIARRGGIHERPLVGVVGHQLTSAVEGKLETLERLVRGDDLAHAGIDRLEVGIREGLAAGQLEVVVEAVVDRGPAGEGGPRPQPEHCLCQHVGRRMPDVLEGRLVAVGEEANRVTVTKTRVEIDREAVHLCDERRLRQPGADLGGQIGRGRALVQGARGSVGQRDRDVGHVAETIGSDEKPCPGCRNGSDVHEVDEWT